MTALARRLSFRDEGSDDTLRLRLASADLVRKELAMHRMIGEDLELNCNMASLIPETGAESKAHITADVDKEMEHFAKLRFNFVELEAKYRFLHHLCHIEIENYPTAEFVEELGSKVREGKTALKELKARRVGLKAEVTSNIKHFLLERDAYEKEMENVKTLLKDTEQLRKEHETLSLEKDQLSLFFENKHVTLQNAAEVLKKQQQAYMADEQKLGEMENELAMLEKQLEELDQDRIDADDIHRNTKDRYEKMVADHKKIMGEKGAVFTSQWLEQSIKILGKLSGIKIEDVTEHPCGSHTVGLAIAVEHKSLATTFGLQINFGNGKVTHVKMLNNMVNIDDIVIEGIRRQDISFIVREARGRVVNSLDIEMEMTAIQDLANVEWGRGSRRVRVMDGLERHVMIEVGVDYPRTKGVTLKSTNGIFGCQAQLLEKTKRWPTILDFVHWFSAIKGKMTGGPQ